MKKLLSDFASNTSGHGWGTVSQRELKCGKVLWLIFTIACQLVAVMWVGIIIARYIDFKTKDRMEVKTDHPIQFPSVTVCPLNPFPATQLEQYSIDYLKPDSELSTINKYYELLVKLNGYLLKENTSMDDLWQRLVPNYNLLDSYRGYLANNPTTWNYQHELNDIIPGCMYKKKRCLNGVFEKILHTTFQSCFTYNGATYRNESNMYVTAQGMGGGLSMIIFLDITDTGQVLYNPYHSHSGSSGARVVIHEKGTMPDPDNDGFNIEPGHSIDFGLSVNRRELQKKPWGDCKDQTSLDFGEYKYSKNACRQKCRANLIYKTCGCVHETLPMLNVTLPSGDVFCSYVHFEEWLKMNPNISMLKNDLIRLECLDRYLNYTWAEISKEHGCECRQNCVTHSYSIETSQAIWPRKRSETGFYCRQIMTFHPNYVNSSIYKRFHERASDCLTVDNLNNIQNDVGGEFRDNFIRLNIYFKDLDTRVTIQDEDFPFWSMLCEVGGILGFFIGVSIISIAEYLLFCFNILHYVSFKKLKIDKRVGSGSNHTESFKTSNNQMEKY